MKRNLFLYLFLGVLLLTSCTPAAAQDPGMIFTVVASTQTAAAWQTQLAEAAFSKTPTQATLRPTFTPYPTNTVFVLRYTPSPTQTFTPTITNTPSQLTEWPEWSTGEVVRMPKGSGANIGVNKRFYILAGVQVMVTRNNGVKLRDVPNKAQPGPVEEPGSAMTLTGVMNKNGEYDWLFAQVIAANGKTYWVGGSENEDTDPRNSFVFYYPKNSPTPNGTLTATITITPTYTTTPATKSPTPPPIITLSVTDIPTATPTP